MFSFFEAHEYSPNSICHNSHLTEFHSWGKFRIGIHPELIRSIPNYSDICIRANAIPSENRFESRLLKNARKLIRLNPIQSEKILIWILRHYLYVKWEFCYMEIFAFGNSGRWKWGQITIRAKRSYGECEFEQIEIS